jgi:hypothetical protein
LNYGCKRLEPTRHHRDSCATLPSPSGRRHAASRPQLLAGRRYAPAAS